MFCGGRTIFFFNFIGFLMIAKYYVTLTDYGASLVAQAHNNKSIHLTNMVLGDANNQPYEPIDMVGRKTLVNQCASVPIQKVENLGEVTRISSTIGVNIGGFNIHEYGYTDQTGQLVYIANYHGSYKPVLQDGTGGELEIVTDIKANAGAQVLIKIDPTILSASKDWVLTQLNNMYGKIEATVSGLEQRVIQLEHFVERSVDYFYPVGTIVNFGIQNINPNVLFVGTTWVRHGEGRVGVGLIVDSDPSLPDWTKIVGSTEGVFNQGLEIKNLPSHKHSKTEIFNKFAALAQDVRLTTYDKREEYGGLTSSENDNSKLEMEMAVSSLTAKAWEDSTEQSVGNGESFSIVQPSIVVNRWERTA